MRLSVLIFFGLFYIFSNFYQVNAQEITIGSRDLEIMPDNLLGCSILHNGEFAQGGTVVFVEPIKEKMILNYIDVKLKKRVEDEREISVQFYTPKKKKIPLGVLLNFTYFEPVLTNPIKQFAESGWNRIHLKNLNVPFPKHGFYVIISSFTDEPILEFNDDNVIFDFHIYKGHLSDLSNGALAYFVNSKFPPELIYMSIAVDSTNAIVVNAVSQ